MWKSVNLNCRNFKCNNNDKGNCTSEIVHLNTEGTPLIDHLICTEAKEKPPELPMPEPMPDE